MSSIILAHGGVEAPENKEYMDTIRRSALACYHSLNSGTVTAAEEAIKVMEAHPMFNAGYGSVLNLEGKAEMDASVMDGQTGRFGAVAALHDIAHPVSVAHKVMEDTPHVILASEGALKFALSCGFAKRNCISPAMLEAWQKARELKEKGENASASLFTGLPSKEGGNSDTVGCVVCHQNKTAAASSTGGFMLKMPGRVGDTPVPGAGIIATRHCAVVCTGMGEAFIETLTAKYVDNMISQGLHPQIAAEKALLRLIQKKNAIGGILVVDCKNRYGTCHNAKSFPVALMIDGNIMEEYKPVKISW